MRIGELLLQRGAINEEQLRAALETQSNYGDRVGTHLVELGYVDIDVLSKALGELHGVPAALRKHAAAVEKRVLSIFPPRIVTAHKAVPIGFTSSKPPRVVVACVDPASVPVEELAFAAGSRVDVWVAPELLIRACLEKYFGAAPKPGRYLDVTFGARSASSAPPPPPPAQRRSASDPTPVRSPAPPAPSAPPAIARPASGPPAHTSSNPPDAGRSGRPAPRTLLSPPPPPPPPGPPPAPSSPAAAPARTGVTFLSPPPPPPTPTMEAAPASAPRRPPSVPPPIPSAPRPPASVRAPILEMPPLLEQPVFDPAPPLASAPPPQPIVVPAKPISQPRLQPAQRPVSRPPISRPSQAAGATIETTESRVRDPRQDPAPIARPVADSRRDYRQDPPAPVIPTARTSSPVVAPSAPVIPVARSSAPLVAPAFAAIPPVSPRASLVASPPSSRFDDLPPDDGWDAVEAVEQEPVSGSDFLRPVIDQLEASRMMEMATSKEHIGRVLTDWLRSMFGFGVVLIVKNDMAVGWKGFVPDAEDLIEAIAVPLNKPSMFARAFETRRAFCGPPPEDGAKVHQIFWKLLKCTPPYEVLVCPVVLGSRTVNLLYAHAAGDELLTDTNLRQAEVLAGDAAAGYRRLIQKGNAKR